MLTIAQHVSVIVALAASLAVVCQQAPAPAARHTFVPTSAYTTRRMQGWTVHVNRKLFGEKRDLGTRALVLLEAKLLDIERTVPPKALPALQKVPIWLGVDDGHAPCAEYHPNRDWLVSNGYNPDKARCVEIGNAQRFLDWSVPQPSMVLHELAHAYLDQVLTAERPEVEAAYQAALKSGRYDAVLHYNGETKRAYALTDAQEFFAESSEAYFGTNDFYPFVRAELKQHDPATYALMQRLWGK